MSNSSDMPSSNPPWAIIAGKLYDEGGGWSRDQLENVLESDRDFDEREAEQAVDKLIDWDLIEGETVPVTYWTQEAPGQMERVEFSLTERGFEVIHERGLNQQQHRTNRLLVLFTGALVFTAAVQAQVAFLGVSASQRPTFAILLTVLFLAMVGMFWIFDIV